MSATISPYPQPGDIWKHKDGPQRQVWQVVGGAGGFRVHWKKPGAIGPRTKGHWTDQTAWFIWANDASLIERDGEPCSHQPCDRSILGAREEGTRNFNP